MELTALHRRLLNEFQRDFPLTPQPFKEIAENLGIQEQDVLQMLCDLQESGIISRTGAVLRPNHVGVSTLVAMSVPPEKLDQVARIVNAFPEVNHNYEREHEYNLWFVVIASSPKHLQTVLDRIQKKTGHEVLDLPMLQEYHIDLGFELQWK